MTRSIHPTLHSNLQAGTGVPYIIASIGYSDGSPLIESTNVIKYKYTGTTLEFTIKNDIGIPIPTDVTQIWLTRGLIVSEVASHTTQTGRFWIRQLNSTAKYIHAKATMFPLQYVSMAADDTYRNVITNFCAQYGREVQFTDPSAVWLDYQFLPKGKRIRFHDPMKFLNLLAQKYLIYAFDLDDGNLAYIYSLDASVFFPNWTIEQLNNWNYELTNQSIRQYIWKDEFGNSHQSGDVTKPIHNLGFLPSIAIPPWKYSTSDRIKAWFRPNLKITDGDKVQLHLYDHSGSIIENFLVPVFVTEEYGAATEPKWRTTITANPIFHNTEAGDLPEETTNILNFIPITTGIFNNLLSDYDNNLQQALETLDAHTHDSDDTEYFTQDEATYLKLRIAKLEAALNLIIGQPVATLVSDEEATSILEGQY